MTHLDKLIQVIPAARKLRFLLGDGRETGAPLVWTSFLLRQPTDEGLLLYNTLTLELLLVPEALVPALEAPTGTLRETLRQKWFLVPADLDQHATVLELRQALQAMEPPTDYLKKYTVFTTTACNARCAYCFEKDWTPQTMDPETADRAADYMLAHSGTHPFRIDWFGGEPLVNRRAIDRISDRLRAGGARFESVMTTNAYLFDPDTLREDQLRWNLTRCQITLDGPEASYNRIKNYIYPGVNAYQRVLRNVHALTAAGVRVMLRLNFDLSNAAEIRRLAEELGREFGSDRRVSAYAAILYEHADDPRETRSPEERAGLEALRVELKQLLQAGGLLRPASLPRALPWHMCMADSGNMITILPDGHVGLCEQYPRDQFIGSLDSDSFDQTVMERFRAVKPEIPACADCPSFPGCIPLRKCPNQICYPQRRDARAVDTRQAMLAEWLRFSGRSPAEPTSDRRAEQPAAFSGKRSENEFNEERT